MLLNIIVNQKKGYWIKLGRCHYRCSCCGYKFGIPRVEQWKRCPICEAKMKGVKDNGKQYNG